MIDERALWWVLVPVLVLAIAGVFDTIHRYSISRQLDATQERMHTLEERLADTEHRLDLAHELVRENTSMLYLQHTKGGQR